MRGSVLVQEMVYKKSLFRENAVNNLGSHNNLMGSLHVVAPGSYITILVFILAILGILIWAFMGTVSVDVPARGILLPAHQIAVTEKMFLENAKDRDGVLAIMKDVLEKKRDLYSKHYLTTVELEKSEEEYLTAKENLAHESRVNYFEANKLIYKTDHVNIEDSLEALVFVSHSVGKKIAEGMNAYVLPSMISAYEYGYIKGRVKSVSVYPASKELIYRYLGNDALVDEYFLGGAPFIVKVKLEKNPNTVSRLSWTTKKGSAYSIEPGTMVTVNIASLECHPIQLLIK